MIKTGLVSVSFRKFSPEKIIEMVKNAGLCAIEWGGDVHVPHGDVELARKVKDWIWGALNRLDIMASMLCRKYSSF
jgi:3-dehydroshikimate dehydratase